MRVRHDVGGVEIVQEKHEMVEEKRKSVLEEAHRIKLEIAAFATEGPTSPSLAAWFQGP